MTNRADLEALAVRLASMREFLAGSGALDGAWFGDDPLPGMKGRFWWRKAMRRDMDEAISALGGVAGLVEALEAAGAKFREYEQMHEAKIRPPFRGVKWSKQIASENMAAGEKAARNRDMAEMCEAALATFREQGGR